MPKSLENHRKNQEVKLLCTLFCAGVLRESTFIMPRGDEDVSIFTGPLLGLLVNFRPSPQVFKIFNAPRIRNWSPEYNLSYRRYNLQFLKMSDILKHVFLINKYRLAASFTYSLSPDEMAPSFRNLQALKYLLQGRLTKCPMTLSLVRTYVWWCPMTFSLARK
jgi:hypothetical protein